MPTHEGRPDRRSFLAGCLGAASALGQDLSAPNTTIKTDVNVVNVFASVHDKKGQIVKTLTKDDFSIDEDGRPQVIRYFARDSDLELTLGLLVDTSGSQRRVIGEERSASYRFLDRVLREDKDIAFVIRFDREVELTVDLTSSRKRLESGIYDLQVGNMGGGQGQGGQRRRGGGTELYDAVMLASEDVMAKQHGRKAVVVMTDGEDRGSKVSLNTAINSAQKADTLVYAILFADEEPFNAYRGMGGRRHGGGGMPPSRQSGPDGDGKKVLQRLAKETGGSFYQVSHSLPLTTIFERMQDELRSQYSIGYTPDKPAKAGEFRKIHLATRDKTMVVQSRDGYYGTS
ncbi:MAG TPA: VWA domain-containing protein [Bryobacteraceae bacterium]|jgi:VWFA-related protein